MITAVEMMNRFLKVQPVTPVWRVTKLFEKENGQGGQQGSSEGSFYEALMRVQDTQASNREQNRLQKSYQYNSSAVELFFSTHSLMDVHC